MDQANLIGQIRAKARQNTLSQIFETTKSFEDRGDFIYYCWRFYDPKGKLIAGKCLPISKMLINTVPYDFAINHAKFSIDHYTIKRKKEFEVIGVERV